MARNSAVTRVETGIDTAALRALRRNVRALKPDSPEWNRKLGAAYKQAGQIIVDEARRQALSMGGVQAAMAAGIKASTSAAGVSIRVANTSRTPYALAAFYGAERRTGWYAAGRYALSAGIQFDPWIGIRWEVGDPAEGPYAVNPAIHRRVDEAMDRWAKAISELMDEIPTT